MMTARDRQLARRHGGNAVGRRARRRGNVRPEVEALEDRVLMAGDWTGSALPLDIRLVNASPVRQVAHLRERIADPADVRLNSITLSAGEMVTVSVNTVPYGGGLNSALRVFRDTGAGVVLVASNDDFSGRDPSVTFQAAASGTYYFGIASFDNAGYDPSNLEDRSGTSRGLFDLDISKTGADPASRIVVASVQLSRDTAAWGDPVTITYTVENRGGLASDPFTLAIVPSADNRFDDGVTPLATVTFDEGLAAGASVTRQIVLDHLGATDTPLGSFGDAQPIYLGLGIDGDAPAGSVAGNGWAPLSMLHRVALADGETHPDKVGARAIDLDSRIENVDLGAGTSEYFRLTLTEPGNLSASLLTTTGAASLTLYDADGHPIVRSDGTTAGGLDPLIVQTLPGSTDGGGTTYYVKVATLNGGPAAGGLTVRFTPSISSLQQTPLSQGSLMVLVGDLDGDGRPDLITTESFYDYYTYAYQNNVRVLLGNGDGSYRSGGRFDAGVPTNTVVAGDFNGDGRIDLAVGTDPNGLNILLGNGDGTFQSPVAIVDQSASLLSVGDFDGDGLLDLAAVRGNGITLLHGDGTGGFDVGPSFRLGADVTSLLAADMDGDGRADLVVVQGNHLSLLRVTSDNDLESFGERDQGDDFLNAVAGDFNGDGKLDLAVVTLHEGTVSILHGDGAGAFSFGGTFDVGNGPNALRTADFDGDGRLDVAAVNSFSDNVTILLNGTDGSFSNAGSFDVGATPYEFVVSDINGDGAVDLVASNYTSSDLTVLLGRGDGTFPQTALPSKTGSNRPPCGTSRERMP